LRDFVANEIPYNFNDVPTIKKFYLSNKKIRAIVGPFGCYISDCEYLSFSDGEYRWKKIKDYQEGEKIAVYDLKTKELRFEKPLAYVKLPMQDDWIHIRGSKFFEAIVSPEHVFPYTTPHSDESKAKPISELIRRGITNARVVNTFHIRGETFDLDEWLVRFIAMLSADGHKLSESKWQVCLRKRRKIERLEFLCRKIGVPYSRKVYDSRPTENIFTLDLSSYPQLVGLTKKFPNHFYNLSSDLLDVLVDEILHWDGCFYNGNDRRYFTTIKENAEFIQYASHATGRRASILKVSYPKDNWKDGYIVHISGKGNKKTCFIDKDAPKHESIRYIPPKEGEFKYCFTTSTGFFLVRFNGAIYISGNSGKSSGCVITLLRHTCEQMPDPYGVRRTRFVIIRNCYSDDTEILTEKRGWVLFKDLLPDDKVAQYNPASGDIEFVRPTYYYHAYYAGKMIWIHSALKGLDLLVTPDHKLYVSVCEGNKWSPYKFVTAKDCYGKKVAFMSYMEELITDQSDWFVRDYKGMVYCVEVPTHIVLVRRNGKPVLCSQTYRMLRDTTKKTIDHWLRFAEWKESEFKYILRFRLPDNTIVESEWLLRALDRPEHIANLYSLEVTGAWLNEAKEIPKEIFDTIEGRLRYPPTVRDEKGNVIYGPTWLGILLDTNPSDTIYWLYQ